MGRTAAFDEMRLAGRNHPCGSRAGCALVEHHTLRRARQPQGGGGAVLPPHRHHLQCLRRRAGHRAADPVRHHSARADRRPNGHALAKGLEQRVKALNAFIADVYGEREIVAAGIVPEDLVLQNPAFQPEMTRIKPPGGVYVHIAGIDVVRVDADTFYVLEDNARTPSGVSYMLENREAMMRLLPELFGAAAHRAGRQLPRQPARDVALGGATRRIRRADRRCC